MRAFLVIILSLLLLQSAAQKNKDIKPATISMHVFYTDFGTAAKIRSSSVKNVLQNKLWSGLNDMQMGLGFTYHKGITNKVNFLATIDGSFTDYLYKNGITNGSSQFLLDVQTAVNIKLLTDKHTIIPYLSGGAGVQLYKGKAGIYMPAGIGLQFNFFKEAMVFTNAQYRFATDVNTNYHFYYSVGIGSKIGLKKKEKLIVIKEEIVKPVVTMLQPEPIKIITKNIEVIVLDEATKLPLTKVSITLQNGDGQLWNGTTDINGKTIFTEVAAGNYSIKGSLNNIASTIENIDKNSFENKINPLSVTLTHNDPRFTLVGNTIDKSIGQPVGNTQVNITNRTQNTNEFTTSKEPDGAFSTQLAANGEFVIFAKKAGFISNIEKINTLGLNRSTTLYVNLELGIAEAKVGKNIILNNIYFEPGKAVLNTNSSTDLLKLVQFLKDNPLTKLEIQGYTDNTGNAISNKKLSEKRANSIVDYLVLNGVNKSRLTAKGFGALQPVADNTTTEGKAKNRRVEMKVVE